jgi:hypothetical protein
MYFVFFSFFFFVGGGGGDYNTIVVNIPYIYKDFDLMIKIELIHSIKDQEKEVIPLRQKYSQQETFRILGIVVSQKEIVMGQVNRFFICIFSP